MARRRWMTRDVVDLFNSHVRGYLPFRVVGNWDMDDTLQDFSIPLDPYWPFGIPDSKKSIIEPTTKE